MVLSIFCLRMHFIFSEIFNILICFTKKFLNFIFLCGFNFLENTLLRFISLVKILKQYTLFCILIAGRQILNFLRNDESLSLRFRCELLISVCLVLTHFF